MRGIAIGESDFRNLRQRDEYYIDKTMYIKHIIDSKSKVILITRPRRFGKTLNMSMLRYYFDCRGEDNTNLFTGLKIMEQEEYISKLGYYPCIYLTLKDLKNKNYEAMMQQFRIVLSDLYIEYVELLNSKKILDIEKEMFNTILNLKANETEMKNSIKMIAKILSKQYEKKVMLIIDEYDVPIQSA